MFCVARRGLSEELRYTIVERTGRKKGAAVDDARRFAGFLLATRRRLLQGGCAKYTSRCITTALFVSTKPSYSTIDPLAYHVVQEGRLRGRWDRCLRRSLLSSSALPNSASSLMDGWPSYALQYPRALSSALIVLQVMRCGIDEIR